jgi:acetyltransferase-like isoleucine patch superfamily enzyme
MLDHSIELELTHDLFQALTTAGLEILWSPGQATISSDFKFEGPSSAKWMQIKSGVELGAYSYAVSGYFKSVSIGRYTSIGEDVQFGRGNHSSVSISNSPIFSLTSPLFNTSESWRSNRLLSEVVRHEELPRTYVGNDVWIGHGSFIKPGITIGDGAIVGAASVVTKDVKPFSVVAGNPARLIRMRFPDEVIENLLQIKWWEYDIADLDGINFGDITSVLQKVPDIVQTTEFSQSRSVSDFIFTRQDMEKLGVPVTSFLSHHSGVEYAVIASPNRFLADNLFVFNRSRAFNYYKQSIKVRESHQIYTLLNGANCAASLLGQKEFADKWLQESMNYRFEDVDYFEKTFPHALFSNLNQKTPKKACEFLDDIGISVPDYSSIELEAIFVGFPRCGTTASSSLAAQADNLNKGITLENFPNITSRESNIDELFESYELNLSLGNLFNQNNITDTKFVDKSTILCMSQQLLNYLADRYPTATIYATTRDPFERSVSAYKRSQVRFHLDVRDCVEREKDIIMSLGGVRAIFESLDVLKSYLSSCSEFHLDYPMIYPSVLMRNWETLVSDSLLTRIKLISLINQEKVPLNWGNTEQLTLLTLNSSSALKNPLSQKDIGSLRNVLLDDTIL